MEDRIEESHQRESAHHRNWFSEDARKDLVKRSEELLNYRQIIEEQEKELNAFRVKLKHEQLAREKEFQRELEAREQFFAEREKMLFDRQRESEKHLMHRQSETEALRSRLEKEIVARESQLQQSFIELQQEKDRYTEDSRKKIELTSKDYVSDALETLDKKETQFHLISKRWSAVGAGALMVGLGFFGFISLSSVISFPIPITWEFIVFSMVKGMIALALLAGLSKYSFLLSGSYMREALKNADRRHAINFGKFYLESYGAAAEWSQVKEAFEHWNISGANAFAPKEDITTVDVLAFEKAVALVERVGKSLPKAKGD